ncbi:MAG: DKNYY domain-containing protein [Tannerellaceae bacterium]|nr:DKNYY domain-containing protein [Tannerellaceae bacterium]
MNNLYAKDQNNVFFQTEIIKNADPETFEYVDYPFTKDKNNVYYEAQKIESADAATFELFKDTYKDYSRDKDHVFYKNSIVSGVDPETFEKFIGSNCWIDKNHVFINGEIIKNSHAPTFGYFHDKSAYSGDKNDIYYNNVGMNVDLPSFRILGKGFAIDKNHVYGDGKILEQYNIETFNIKATH